MVEMLHFYGFTALIALLFIFHRIFRKNRISNFVPDWKGKNLSGTPAFEKIPKISSYPIT